MAEARTWLRTPYHHRGSIKGVGVDCAHFPMAVYSACGLILPIDTYDYPPDWHMHRSEERYLNQVRAVATEIDLEKVGPGDFVLFKVGRCYAHGAIVIEWPRIIHAVLRLGVTAGSSYDGMTAGKPIKAFTLWS